MEAVFRNFGCLKAFINQLCRNSQVIGNGFYRKSYPNCPSAAGITKSKPTTEARRHGEEQKQAQGPSGLLARWECALSLHGASGWRILCQWHNANGAGHSLRISVHPC